MNKQFNELNITELKALAFDQLVEIEKSNKNLQIINKRIEELSVPPEATKVKTK